MIRFKDMHRLLNIPYVAGNYFSVGMITNLSQSIVNANELLSLVLKFTSLISFAIFILLNFHRIKVRIAQIFRKKNKKK